MKKQQKNRFTSLLAACAMLGGVVQAASAEGFKPYTLGWSGGASIEAKASEAKNALASQGFEVVGEYSPYDGAHVIAVTHQELKSTAVMNRFGGFGVALSVSLSRSPDGTVELSYNNPGYMANVYRMSGSLNGVTAALNTALGKQQDFGSRKERKERKLRKYHYMIGMPYFDDMVKLASYTSHQQAVDAVEQGLASGLGGTSKVYRVDVPGVQETLFGVAINSGDGADDAVMRVTDKGSPRHTPHLPYEMLVSNGEVYSLHGRFRIAQSFPDLSMGTFMKISGAPGAIADALRAAAGG